MAFFDLNIPYNESTKRNSTADKSLRLKLTIKAMELGYTGVAYNRTITGVMSELDRCSISLFPLSSVLKVSPAISSAVNVHRRLLDVPIKTPFRQYTRITVVVDTPAQGSCLNSGNPVLKTYDVVAVRPMKQECFDLACKNYEVDIIFIDFSETRFRLKQPLIKAAIERGVCFEITYSGLLMDAQLRRQIISNAKLLVDWTRGKNVIFSSAAASLTEFRGPNDVANLACLLGFSKERAKASISKTCRSLLENSIRKKKFFKEAIRVQLISSTDDGFDEWLKWDPISSGEGDLQLDDMAKSFAAANKEPKTVKAIDFVSVINELPSHGLQIIDLVTEKKVDSKLHDPHDKDHLSNLGKCDVTSINKNLETSASVEAGETCAMIIEEPEQKNLFLKVHEDIHEAAESLETSASVEAGETCAMIIEASEQKNLPLKVHEDIHEAGGNLETSASVEASETCSMIIEEPEQKNWPLKDHEDIHEAGRNLETLTSVEAGEACAMIIEEPKQQNLPLNVHEDVHEDVIDEKERENVCSDVPNPGILISFDDNNPSNVQCEEANNFSSSASIFQPSTKSNEADRMLPTACLPEAALEEHTSDTKDVAATPVSSSLNEDILEQINVIEENVSTAPSSSLPTLRSHDELQINGCNSVVHEPPEDVTIKVNVEVKDDSGMNHLSAHKSSSGRVRRKHRISSRPVSFPFKRLLKPSYSKKAQNKKRKKTIL
ncbi:hypothetical protein QVD17_17608 [Tagetes erecta]|uniref:Uncharacterized protein n=1 Tax=Tagetes erecta TaxID=13708 RepID=A0AAD8KWD3_TARER|nr:hypothetical protein QVD17_17608 [Tagetes erecta]